MAASPQLVLPALSERPADVPADPGPAPDSAARRCAAGAEHPGAGAPLTSEPPLPDAAPLTSEPPPTDATPLTSEPTATGTAAGPDLSEV